MNRFYYDTETTGFPGRAGAPLTECPYIVQLAAIVTDPDWNEVASMNVIIKPDGWVIPEGAAAVHGITTEKAEKYGIPIKVAMAMFSNICRIADQAIAHNNGFDRKLVGYEIDRLSVTNILETKQQFCTMEATTEICQLPGRYPGKFKWPKLSEAYQFFFGEPLDGAHDALVDVRGCARIHRHGIEKNLF